MERPEVDSIDGLSPAISIEQIQPTLRKADLPGVMLSNACEPTRDHVLTAEATKDPVVPDLNINL